ncbi:MAG: cytochrome c family protein [Agarilytica sp.]
MDILLRDVSTQGDHFTYQDTEIKCDKLSIGSSRNANIHLCGENIALQHFTISFQNARLNFECKKKSRISLNGNAARKGPLNANDEIQLESHRLRIIPSPAGFDLALEIYIDQDLQNKGLESAYDTSIDDASWGTRGPAYVLSLLVILFGLMWPIYSHYQNSVNAPVTTGTLNAANTQVPAIHSGDKYWSTGPLFQAHQVALGDNCSACHKRPFEQVKDEACEDCHHADPHIHPAHTQAFSGQYACQTCHKEHNEPNSIVITSDVLCIDCHSENIMTQHTLLGQAQKVLPAVTGFTKETHAQFKLSYLQPLAAESKSTPQHTSEGKKIARDDSAIVAMEWQKIQESFDLGRQEQSNLKFDHQVHLDGAKMRTSDKPEGMECADCHTLKSDNEHFEPLVMEKHCVSCHQLNFDTENLERQLPHGKPKEVVRMLEAHYVRTYTDPSFKPENSGSKRRRLGSNKTTQNCSTPFECGMNKAATEAEAQFTKGVCNYCHQVTDTENTDTKSTDTEGQSIYTRWQVMPVIINDDWYPHAAFDHVSHQTKKEDATDTCLSCHDALHSDKSADVLIPGIHNCLECHGDSTVDKKITLNCVSCHEYHPVSKKQPTP